MLTNLIFGVGLVGFVLLVRYGFRHVTDPGRQHGEYFDQDDELP